MKKNIETMWKQGFLADEDLIAPKINDLYNKKSQHIVSELTNKYVWLNRTVFITSFIVLAVFGFWGIPYLGLFIFSLCMLLVWQSKQSLNNLSEIDNSDTSYDYLVSFQLWLKNQANGYTTVYRYFYSLLVLGVFTQWRFSESAQLFLKQISIDFPNLPLILGTPVYLLALVLAICGLLYKYGGALYQADIDLVYGRTLKKLEELVKEMEELRK